MRLNLRRLAGPCFRSRVVADERGIALVMALGIMLVLTIVLTSVIFLTASSARDAQRSNASQKAYALAQAGVNNALAVLNANYPGTQTYPGDSTLLTTAGCPCTSTYPTGTVLWSGSLVAAPAGSFWNWEWDLTATGSVTNPTGPTASPVTRKATAVVPIVIPTISSIDPTSSSLDWVYAHHDVTFGQSLTVKSPVFAGNNLNLTSSAKISELIPASINTVARQNKVAVVGNLSLASNQNQIGHVETSTGTLAEIHVHGTCSTKQNGTPHSPCGGTDPVWGDVNDSADPTNIVTAPEFTCCIPESSAAPVNVPAHLPAAGATTSIMGFWYENASLGPRHLCATSTGTPPRFDTPASVGPDAADGSLNQSATAAGQPFDLTGASSYSCTSANGLGILSWNAGTKRLTIKGQVFIDGSVTSSSTGATYTGQGALIISGTFLMTNQTLLCVALDSSGNNCKLDYPWDPNVAGMFIMAGGLFTTDRSLQNTNAYPTGTGIEIFKGQFQGGLLAANNVDASVTGSVVQGPMVSAYGDVSAGQSGFLSFPAIAFPSSGTDGFTGPLPLPQLLPPRQFGGG
jgi:hypothetical protein